MRTGLKHIGVLLTDCEALDDIPNAYPVQNTTFSHGSVAAYSCHPGYRLNGQAMRICNYGFWSEPTPVCEPVGKYMFVGMYYVILKKNVEKGLM